LVKIKIDLLEDFMKRFVSGVVLTLLVGLFVSCVSLQDRTMTPQERAQAEVVGSVTVEFISVQPVHIILKDSIKSKAISLLKAEASKKYQGNIDIQNITIGGSFSGWNILSFCFLLSPPVLFNVQKITASADVVLYNSVVGNSRTLQQTVEGALSRAAQETLKNVPARSKIAIVYITAQDRSTTEYVAGELEYIWVNAGYTIIDRSQLDRIRREQNFQMSGEVDDNTAVSIGKIIGANIIVTGRVDGEGNLRRLRLRALDTQTAQVVGVASERL
jgi:hypothetical protein